MRKQDPSMTIVADDPWTVALADDCAGALGVACHTVAGESELAAVLMKDERAILVVDVTCRSMSSPKWLESVANRTETILLVPSESESPIALLERFPKLDHVLAKSPFLSRTQLEASLSPLLGLASARGVSGYLTSKERVETVRIADCRSKRELIDRIKAFVEPCGGFHDLPAAAATIAWELVMNGLFNAPIDPVTGIPKYRQMGRDEDHRVGAGEETDLVLAADEHTLAIAVSDPFGALEKETVVRSLIRASGAQDKQILRTTKGAGVGLYMTYMGASQLDFKVKKRVRTEIVATVRLSKRLRDFQESGHSINFFFEE